MRKQCRVILSLLLAFVVILSLSVPAFAEQSDYTSTVVTWWDQLLYSVVNDTSSSAAQTVAGWVSSGSVCPTSTDGLHHAGSLASEQVGYDNDGGYYALARCSYCGDEFKVYSSSLRDAAAETDASRDFDGVTSDGKLIYEVPFSYHSIYAWNRYGTDGHYFACPHCSSSYQNSVYPYIDGSFDCDHLNVVLTPSSGNATFALSNGVRCTWSFPAPITGEYFLIGSSTVTDSSYFYDKYNNRCSFTSYYSSATSGTFYNAGNTVSYNLSVLGDSSYRYADLTFNPITLFISPAQSSVVPSSSTRPTSVTNYWGDNGGHNYTDNSTSIVSEDNSTYYNPVTNTTSNVQSWSYDYSDRSYNITTESGDTVTVTYGDENVTINEGDTIYNIYYTIPTSDIVQPPHTHTWELSSKTEYCTLPGEAVYTCSECGETKSEATTVLGHSWVVEREVHTQYDQNGDLVQEGYILYECSRCGEQYKAPSGGSPPASNNQTPGGSSGTSSGSSSGLSRVFQNSSAVISQNYGTDGHTGTDCVPSGGGSDVVIAHSEGEVVWTQTGQTNNQGSSGDASYGNCVKIRHTNGYYTLYAHLASVNVSTGDHVLKGQPLGVMGNTGNSYGAHLHFEVRDSSDANINSDPYLNADLPDFEGGGTASSSSDSGGGLWSSIGNLIGSLFGGVIKIGTAILSKILDALTNLVEIITGKLAQVVEAILGIFDEVPQMFGGFLDFLTGMFVFLPPEISTLLVFGVAAIVLIGIIKAVRR